MRKQSLSTISRGIEVGACSCELLDRTDEAGPRKRKTTVQIKIGGLPITHHTQDELPLSLTYQRSARRLAFGLAVGVTVVVIVIEDLGLISFTFSCHYTKIGTHHQHGEILSLQS